jgi:hypothetical protein
MNWKRGLFRLWLIGAIFWIVGSGWYYHIATCFSVLAARDGTPMGLHCVQGWGDEAMVAHRLNPGSNSYNYRPACRCAGVGTSPALDRARFQVEGVTDTYPLMRFSGSEPPHSVALDRGLHEA